MITSIKELFDELCYMEGINLEKCDIVSIICNSNLIEDSKKNIETSLLDDEEYDRLIDNLNLRKIINNEKKINNLLSQISDYISNEYTLGFVLSFFLYNGLEISKVDKKIINIYLKSLNIEKYNKDSWEVIKYNSKLDEIDESYIHFNFYELFIDYDSFSKNIDSEELYKVLLNLKKIGYIYVLVSSDYIPMKYKECTYGILEKIQI